MSDMTKHQQRKRGRPSKYQDEAERKAARAKAARKRRATIKELGFKEIRKVVKNTMKRPYSAIIDLSALYNNKRKNSSPE